jgi:uncharacterized protein
MSDSSAQCSTSQANRFAMMKAEYEKAGPEPSNTRYGYVVPKGPMDYSVFA